MKKFIFTGFLLIGTCLMGQSPSVPDSPAGLKYSWEKPHAKVLDNGDLGWQPEDFNYIVGPAVRYIDFEGGNDNNNGTGKTTAWKHHPWDPDATGTAQSSNGIFTYVKKGEWYIVEH